MSKPKTTPAPVPDYPKPELLFSCPIVVSKMPPNIPWVMIGSREVVFPLGNGLGSLPLPLRESNV